MTAPVFRRIFWPVDFSENCDDAGAHAAWLAGMAGGDVAAVHVIGNPADPIYSPEDVTYWAMVKHAEQKAMALLHQAADRCLGTQCRRQFQVLQGDPYEKLIAAIAAWQPDIIVMSTHGRTGLAHLLLGSVAEKIVRHAPCPVLVLRRARVASAGQSESDS